MVQCTHALTAFTGDPARHIARVRLLLDEVQPQMIGCAIRLLQSGQDGDWKPTLINLLVAHGLAETILDSAVYSLREAVKIAEIASSVDRGFDIRLVRLALNSRMEESAGRRKIRRVLDVLGALPRNARMLPMLIRFLRSTDPPVRSKAVLLAARVKREARFAQPYLNDSDARVRANAVEALWSVNDPDVRAIFHRAAMDSHPRVVANAVVGLYLSRDPGAAEVLREMLSSRDPRVTASAVWVVGRCREQAFLPFVREMALSDQPPVRRAALLALVRINSRADRPSE
ncbi:MAG: HEAT repeat domain-containing protein [Bryobacterales bacterium]|nr:HEAT repeat domain-containing protein [Bryobacterales bacterium]